MTEINQRRVLSQILNCFIFVVLFSKYYGFVKKSRSSQTMLYVRKNQIALIEMTLETQRIYLDSCSLMRNVGISQWSMMVENVLEILAKKKLDVLQQPIDVHSVTNVVGENISSVTCGIFVGNQLGKHGFSCDFFTKVNMKDCLNIKGLLA